MRPRSGTVTRPGSSSSVSVRALSCGRGRPGRGSSGSTPSTRICGRRSSTCSRAGTRTARCGSRARSGRTGRHAVTGPKGGATSPPPSPSGQTSSRSDSSIRCGADRFSPSGRATSTKASSSRHASSRSRRRQRTRSMSTRWRSTCLRSPRADGVIATRHSRCSRSRWRSAVAGVTSGCSRSR